ncbi:MAG: LegC family aminotransferase [Cellvibrionaceae bacterium]
MFNPIFECIEKHFGAGRVGLHEPLLGEIEKQYLNQVIDSGFVSTAGVMVEQFEQTLIERTGAKYCVALVNGTAALQLGLIALGVKPNDEVITQSLTFIATANAIHHCGADPVFVDVDEASLGMSVSALAQWLDANVELKNGVAVNRSTGKTVRACVPMHTFGLAVDIEAIVELCESFGIAVMEDAAEALGSSWRGKALGTFSRCGVFSFNGNKVITTGGGGALVTDDQHLADQVRHLSTTAKLDVYRHDRAAFNFRMPNLNAALGCAQLTRLDAILSAKKSLAQDYQRAVGQVSGVSFFQGRESESCNYWLSAVIFESLELKNVFLARAERLNVQCRSVWQLLHKSLPYRHCQTGSLSCSESLAERVLCLPSMPAGEVVQ